MFRTRLISGILLVLFTLFVMIYGGSMLLIPLFIISEIGLYELYKVMKMEKGALGLFGYAGVFGWYAILFFKRDALQAGKCFLLIASVLLIAMLAVFVFGYPRFSAVQLFTGVFGFFYVPMMLSFLFLTRETVRLGEWLVWLVYIASWGSDTCAYVAGRLFGKHKLAPVLSPKKSVEGSVGGILGSALIGAGFAYAMCKNTGETYSLIPVFAMIGAAGSVISQVGDLAASGIKRNFDVKDYGKLIPGHGGILDRFDSVIITAPIVYFLADRFVGGF